MISIAPRSFSWCYTEFGGRGIFWVPWTPLYLAWCYTELGQGRSVGIPVPFLVLHRVRAGPVHFGDDHRRGGRFGAGGSGVRVDTYRFQGVRLPVNMATACLL